MPALSKRELSQWLPHSGTMCLLDSIRNWDPITITGLARSHRDRENPLMREGELEALCGLEYAAQAMGIHAGLVRTPDAGTPFVGYLGGLKDLQLAVGRLDDIEEDLEITATRILGGNASMMYTFSVCANGKELLSGRASIFIQYETSRGVPPQ